MNWVVKVRSTIWWSGTIKIFKWLKILGETNDNEGLERRLGALYLVTELRYSSHDSELICGLEKGDSSIVGSSSELVTAPVRAGQALEETTALMSVLVWHGMAAARARGWCVRDLDCVRGSQLESSGVATSSSGHPDTKWQVIWRDGYTLAGRMKKIRILAFVVKTWQLSLWVTFVQLNETSFCFKSHIRTTRIACS